MTRGGVGPLHRRYGQAVAKPYEGTPPPGAVLTLYWVARPDLVARLHAPDCPMVTRMAGKRFGPVKINRKVDAEDIADLNERGFPVRICKCLKGP